MCPLVNGFRGNNLNHKVTKLTKGKAFIKLHILVSFVPLWLRSQIPQKKSIRA